MTGDADDAAQPDTASELRLRARTPRVTRLSRKMLIGLGGVAALAIAGAFGYALQTRHGNDVAKELYSTDNRPTADGLANLPRDYTGMPRNVPPLGPALPGDLGPAIVDAQNRGKSVPAPGQGVDPAEERRLQEIEAARASGIFAQTEQQPADSQPSGGVPVPDLGVAVETPPVDASAAQNMQDRKLAFVNAPVDRRTVSPDRLANPASPYILQAGSVIPAALITGIRSDLPGLITAQVTENVYDSSTGNYLLIPQGARLIGEYDSSVAFGQSRVLLVWTRIIMPDGQSIVLERQEGADTQGYAGLEDRVDYHWGELAKAAVLSTLLGVGSDLGDSGSDNSGLVHALRQGTQDSINNAGQQIVRRQLNIQPTLTIRPGFPVRVIADRDIVLAPYGGGTTP